MKVFKRIITVLLLPLIIIGGINYLIDPDYTLKKNYIPKLTSALLSGKSISGPVNINSRILKKDIISEFSSSPKILVLGSSRTLSLQKEIFPGKTFYNASVTNCTIQDMYVFTNILSQLDGLPSTIIICADQWLFGDSFSEIRWLNNRKDFKELFKQIDTTSNYKIPSKWKLDKEWIKELFSVRYMLRSLRYPKKTETFEITDTIVPSEMMLLPDGSRILPSEMTNVSAEESRKKALDYFYSSTDEHFNSLSEIHCQLFENLIAFFRQNNCQVIVFIPPYHPEAIRLFRESVQTEGIFKVDNYMKKLSEKYDFKIIGGTDPELLELSGDNFYDAVHLKPSSLANLFQDE